MDTFQTVVINVAILFILTFSDLLFCFEQNQKTSQKNRQKIVGFHFVPEKVIIENKLNKGLSQALYFVGSLPIH
jgi:hypothetical protein